MTSPDQPVESIQYALAQCSLGALLAAQGPRGVCAILLGDDPETLRLDLRRRFPRAALEEAAEALAPLAARLAAFVENPSTPLDLPIDPRGTDFQRRVWRALREIPPGETVTYTQLAQRIGAPAAARAVAQACAANPLAVVIPCHRVVRAGGALSGYRWGMQRKRALLEREARGKKA